MGMVINPFFVVPPAPATFLRTVVGNKDYTASSTSTSSANGKLVKISVPAGNSALLSAVQIAVNTSTGQNAKALLVADSGGSPSSTVLAIGTATSVGTISNVDTVVTLPFASDQTLSASTDYWVGFVPSAAFAIITADTNFSNTTGYEYAVTYASPTWDASTDTATDRHAIWAVVKQGATITGTHQLGSTALFANASTKRMGLPDHAIGDKVYLQMGTDFGVLPTTPSGWTKTYDDQINGNATARHAIYTRTIDGTEDGTVYFDAPSATNRWAVATVFRGGGTIEGKQVATSAGTSAVSTAVTTSGSNRRVFNFLCSGLIGGGGSNTQSADSWTDVYSLGTTFGNDYTMSLSYKDVAAAGSSGTETRTISNGWWHVTSFAIPDV